MSEAVHFVQGGDGPVLIGSGAGTLDCSCGQTLIHGFRPSRFLALGIRCGQCGTVTGTAPLPEGELPPRSAIVAAPSTVPRMTAMTVPPDVSVVGQAEMQRLQALFQPVTPADNIYRVTPALLDEVAAAFEQHVGAALPDVDDEPFSGLRTHALGWAVRHLRGAMQAPFWTGMGDPATANAVTHVTGFLHFVATWSRHPLFPAMLGTVVERRCSLHGLAPFAAAHCLAMLGNRLRMPEPVGDPGRIEDFSLVTGTDDAVAVHVDVFDRFEFPFGRAWDPASLQAAVSDVIGAAQGRINLRNPGVLVLSPGAALAGYDEALIEAIKAAVQVEGRRNRGLVAVTPVMLRLQALPEPHAVRFVYGLFPIANRHYRGDSAIQMGGV